MTGNIGAPRVDCLRSTLGSSGPRCCLSLAGQRASVVSLYRRGNSGLVEIIQFILGKTVSYRSEMCLFSRITPQTNQTRALKPRYCLPQHINTDEGPKKKKTTKKLQPHTHTHTKEKRKKPKKNGSHGILQRHCTSINYIFVLFVLVLARGVCGTRRGGRKRKLKFAEMKGLGWSRGRKSGQLKVAEMKGLEWSREREHGQLKVAETLVWRCRLFILRPLRCVMTANSNAK